MMHIIGTAHDADGNFYYILKNSWGRIGPYEGLVYMSQAYFRSKTVSVVLFQED
jgi:bleomycin hydrolase